MGAGACGMGDWGPGPGLGLADDANFADMLDLVTEDSRGRCARSPRAVGQP